VSSVQLSKLSVEFSRPAEIKRLDVGYHRPEKIESVEILRNSGYEIVNLVDVLMDKPRMGIAPPATEYREAPGLPIIKVANLSSRLFIDRDPRSYVTGNSDYTIADKGVIQENDILLLCAAHQPGYIGLNTSIVPKLNEEIVLHVAELIRLRPNVEEIDPYYLTVLLNHPVIRTQLRNSVRGVTIHLYPADLKQIQIIRPQRSRQKEIGKLVQVSYELYVRAYECRLEVTKILRRYLPSIAQSESLISFDYSANQCKAEERLDARFFNPKYAPLLRDLAKRSSLSLEDASIGKIHRGTFQGNGESDGTIPALKTTNVHNGKVNWGRCIKVSEEYFEQNPRSQVGKNDILITSTGEGSWGRAAICDIERAVAEGHLSIATIDPRKVNPYSAVAFLWDDYGQLQFEQRVRGATRQTEIHPQDIKRIRLLVPSPRDQEVIAEKVNEEFDCLDKAQDKRRDAIQLLGELLGG
jgi:hypothetical protein